MNSGGYHIPRRYKRVVAVAAGSVGVGVTVFSAVLLGIPGVVAGVVYCFAVGMMLAGNLGTRLARWVSHTFDAEKLERELKFIVPNGFASVEATSAKSVEVSVAPSPETTKRELAHAVHVALERFYVATRRCSWAEGESPQMIFHFDNEVGEEKFVALPPIYTATFLQSLERFISSVEKLRILERQQNDPVWLNQEGKVQRLLDRFKNLYPALWGETKLQIKVNEKTVNLRLVDQSIDREVDFGVLDDHDKFEKVLIEMLTVEGNESGGPSPFSSISPITGEPRTEALAVTELARPELGNMLKYGL